MIIEDIKDADYIHAKRVCKDFEMKDLVEYHDLYLKSDTLLLTDVFETFRNIRLKFYDKDFVKFLFSSCISMASSFEKDWSKIKIINWCWYAVDCWKDIKGGICQAIHQYAKANNIIYKRV